MQKAFRVSIHYGSMACELDSCMTKPSSISKTGKNGRVIEQQVGYQHFNINPLFPLMAAMFLEVRSRLRGTVSVFKRDCTEEIRRVWALCIKSSKSFRCPFSSPLHAMR
ncbi:hypothetical protein AVEN_228952-1 [Araneus ventricosus]|uniref:Uncharacterized protein n=1 Tax=Araneus ventricosus TaxID=182803 RepID=A0A4Y2K6D8_ARAVE|nr:hypothetical protein AVEN_228952-1 [Araneus ventricosus]